MEKVKANAILLFFGVLDRGVRITAPRFALSLQPLRESYNVTVACLDLNVSRVDGLKRPQCRQAQQLLGCTHYESVSEQEMEERQRQIRPHLRFRYRSTTTARAFNQLVGEATAAQMARRVSQENGANFIVACCSDFYLVTVLPPLTMRRGHVWTSSQMDSVGGVTNGLYAGHVTDVALVMSRIDVLPSCCYHFNRDYDYEHLLKVSGFDWHNITRDIIHIPKGGPYIFLKVRATCRVIWPVGWFWTKKRVTRPAHQLFVRLSNSLSHNNRSCMSECSPANYTDEGKRLFKIAV